MIKADEIYRTGKPCKPCNSLGTVYYKVDGRRVSSRCEECKGKGRVE